MEHHLTATECHLPYGITQCYLPPDRSEHTPPSPRPVRPVLDLPTSEGWKAELTGVTCYIPRWFTRPQTVTHPSTNRARCRLTSLIKPTPLTTTPRCHLNTVKLVLMINITFCCKINRRQTSSIPVHNNCC